MPIPKLTRWVFVLLSFLYLASAGPNWHFSDDSSLYLMLAENLANGEGYTLFGRPNAFVPPGCPIIFAGLMKVGLGSHYWLNLSMALMGLATLWLSYCYLRELAPAKTAVFVTAFVGVGSLMHEHSLLLLSDVPFMLFVSLGLLGFARAIRGHWWWITLGMAAFVASCWVRIVGIPLCAAACFGLLLQVDSGRRRVVLIHSFVLGGAVLLTGLYFVSYNLETQKAEVPPSSYASNIDSLRDRSVPGWFWEPAVNLYISTPRLARILIGDELPTAIAFVVFCGIIGMGVKVYLRRGSYLGILTTAGYIAAMGLNAHLPARYMLPVLPLISLYFIEGVHRLFGTWAEGRRLAWQRTLAVLLLLMSVHFCKDVRCAYIMHHPRFAELDQKWAAVSNTADVLRAVAGPNERFYSYRMSTTFAYLSDVAHLDLNHRMREWSPQPGELDQFLRKERVALVILDARDRKCPFVKSLTSLISGTHGFEFVTQNGRFEIYRRNPVTAFSNHSKTESPR